MKKGKESAVANYIKSIPKGVTTIRCAPIMRKGVCVGQRISYELDNAQVVKEIVDKKSL